MITSWVSPGCGIATRETCHPKAITFLNGLS
jgi:hypothetical protein